MVNIFPQGLEGTLVIPIFVGLLIMAALTEAWGWDFVGVVVPGYLASVCLSQPVVAGIVVLEAVATWTLAVAIDRGLTRARVTHPVFGRDRFFLVLVASVMVRIAFEGWLLPAAVGRWGGTFPALQAHQHELFGIGLVLVPLCANRLWTAGPARGLFQMLVQTALVVAVLRLVLLRFTNFSLAGFDPSYDPLALAFLTSPRAQMALLITAAIASWLNRRYGWDFHGILVPALLGLAVLAPIKVLATVLEAVLIMSISRALVALPRLRRANFEGARRVVLCFTVGVAFKMVVARTALAHLPGYRPADLLGFGYLLPSLLAERIWRSQSVILVLLPTLQTAAIGFVVSSVAALGLAIAAPLPPLPPAAFASLPEAVLALTARQRQGAGDVAASVGLGGGGSGAPRDLVLAETHDGYAVLASPGPGLLAVRPGAHSASIAPLDEWAGLAAAAAVREGTSLSLGPSVDAVAAARAHGLQPRPQLASGANDRGNRPASGLLRESWATTVRRLVDSAAPAAADASSGGVDLLRPLVAGAAVQLDRSRAAGDDLSRAIAPYRLSAAPSADRAIVVQGAGWPTVVLQPGAPLVVAAGPAGEWGSGAAAIAVCEALGADCVLAGAGDADTGLPAALGLALAERRARPLLIVRGTSRPLGGDLLLIGAPDLGAHAALPAWLQPLADFVQGRLALARQLPDLAGALRAFPVDAGRVSPTALLWCSPFGRRVLSGADHRWWSDDDIQRLARQRRVPVLRTDGLGWLTAGKGPPSSVAIDQAEMLARTSDVAQLAPVIGPARLALLVDTSHDLVGFAIEQGARRALVLAGTRREERVIVDRGSMAAGLRWGARTLLSPLSREAAR
jgi:hypothetical protein